MSGSIPKLQPGQLGSFNASQMQQLQLSSFSPEREEGIATSNLIEYVGYHFTWFTTDDQVSTCQEIDLVYHLTMHKKYDLLPLDLPIILVGNKYISLGIKPNGLSNRFDLLDYHFVSKYLGFTQQGRACYRVTMRKRIVS